MTLATSETTMVYEIQYRSPGHRGGEGAWIRTHHHFDLPKEACAYAQRQYTAEQPWRIVKITTTTMIEVVD